MSSDSPLAPVLRDLQISLCNRLMGALSRSHKAKQSAVLEELSITLVDQSILQSEKVEDVEALVQRIEAPDMESMLLSSFENMMRAKNRTCRAAIAHLTARYFSAGKAADRIFIRCGEFLCEIEPEELRQVREFLNLINEHFSDAKAVIVALRATHYERKRSFSVYTFPDNFNEVIKDFTDVDVDERMVDGFRLLKRFGFGEDVPELSLDALPSGPSAIRLGRHHIVQARELLALLSPTSP